MYILRHDMWHSQRIVEKISFQLLGAHQQQPKRYMSYYGAALAQSRDGVGEQAAPLRWYKFTHTHKFLRHSEKTVFQSLTTDTEICFVLFKGRMLERMCLYDGVHSIIICHISVVCVCVFCLSMFFLGCVYCMCMCKGIMGTVGKKKAVAAITSIPFKPQFFCFFCKSG